MEYIALFCFQFSLDCLLCCGGFVLILCQLLVYVALMKVCMTKIIRLKCSLLLPVCNMERISHNLDNCNAVNNKKGVSYNCDLYVNQS